MSRHFCGCYYVLPTNTYQKHYLPLLDSEAHSTILATTSSTVLKQTFTNSTADNVKECIYTFPIYDGVSVVGFSCKIGAKTMTGVVKEKAQAKKTYDEAVARGETAGLLVQAPQASDVWSTKLGNIAAGQSIIVEITYIGELKHHESDGIRFTIPTYIAPRYGSGPTQAALPTAADKGGIKITVDLHMPEGCSIKSVDSPSHQIKVSMGTLSTESEADPILSKASATLSLGSTTLEKDFALIIHSKDIGIPKALLETHPTIPKQRALMATLVPKFSIAPIRPELVFVADRSGSMGGNIPMLVSALKVFLKSMPAGVKFNICSFGSSHSFLWPKSMAYTSENLETAMEHLKSFASDMGGTQTFEAIKATIEQRFSDLPLEVILLTDGDIWSQDQLFKYVNEQVEVSKGRIRVFTLGIGSGVSHALIEGLARAGNGFAQAVQHGERLEKSVVSMLRGSLSPHISNYRIDIKYAEDDDADFVDITEHPVEVLHLEDMELNDEKEQKPVSISLFDQSVTTEQLAVEIKDAEIKLPDIETPDYLQAPTTIPSLYAFSRNSVYMLMSPKYFHKNPTSVVLRGTSSDGQELSLEIPIETLTTPAQTIHQLAAKKAVQDLEEGRGWIEKAVGQDNVRFKEKFASSFEELVQREAVRLGERYQVAGKWCSFVAVEANDAETAAKKVFEEKSEDSEDSNPEDFSTPLDRVQIPSTGRVDALSLSSSNRRARLQRTSVGGGMFGSARAMFSKAAAPPPPPPPSAAPAVRMFSSRGAAPPPAAPAVEMFDSRAAARKSSSSGLLMKLTGGRPPSSNERAKPIHQEATAPVGWASRTVSEKVLALIELQQFDGSWNTSSELTDIIGIKIPAGKGKEWVTLLVLNWLEVKCAEEEGTWGMVAEKARNWLATENSGTWEGMEAEIVELVKKA